MEKKKIIKIVIIVILIIVAVDQLTKFLASKYVTEKIGGSYIYLEVTENTGMAFGFNEDNENNILLSIFVLIVLISFLRNQSKEIDKKTLIAISMVIGGGCSNLIDRIFRGGVLDFMKILFIPNCNIADICVVLGWILIVIFLIVYTQKEDAIKKESDKIEEIKEIGNKK